MEEVDEKIEEAIRVMEAQIKAKRAILEESLRVVTDPKQMENCRKRRQYIKEVRNMRIFI